MIDVIIADHEEIFRIGMAAALAVADDFRIVGLPRTIAQLLDELEAVSPHVLISSTIFLPVFPEIQRKLRPHETALLVLADEDDHAPYMRCLGVRGIVYRSMDGPIIVDAMRRVARGDWLVQSCRSNTRRDPSEAATRQRNSDDRQRPAVRPQSVESVLGNSVCPEADMMK